jgi:glycine cleavage system H protein
MAEGKTIPTHLKYTEDHEWVEIEDGIATVGITDYAQNELGDVVFVELPEIGEKAVQGKAFGLVEAVKTVSDLFAPVSGEIIEINHHLTQNPGLMNESPYDEGWVIKIRVQDEGEIAILLDAEGYSDHIGA